MTLNNITYVATCLFGLESLVGAEIEALGYKRAGVQTVDGRVVFEGDLAAMARANINLRYAERVLIRLGEFSALTFDELFEGAAALPWEVYIGASDAFPVRGHCIKSKLFSVPDCQRIINAAVAKRLCTHYGLTRMPEDGVKYQIEFFIFKDRAWLMIDTSGAPLHKRGYRPEAAAAPMRETLAAALASLSRPRENVLFWDPMCGSGTIAIEAALLMTNTAPGISRSFACNAFPQIDKTVWDNARDEAFDNIKDVPGFQVYASDIDPACVDLTQANIRRAGVSSSVRTFVRDALTIETEGRRGSVICNPPYGERLMTTEQTDALYRAMGEHFATLDRWQFFIITSCDYFERLFGRKANRVRKLYNGMIPCFYYQFTKESLI